MSDTGTASNIVRAASQIGLVALSSAVSLTAFAEGLNAPPRHDSQSPTGVSYRSGSFNYSETDLSIGGDFPAGLELRRTYNSALSNGVPSPFPMTGWSENLSGYVSNQPLPLNPDDPPPLMNRNPYVYHVVFDGHSVGFLGGSQRPATGGPIGSYSPIEPSGASLTYVVSGSTGAYHFIDSDGSALNFSNGGGMGRLIDRTLPDGTKLTYTYDSSANIRSVFTNRGYAILFESPQKACAVNLALVYVTATSNCPSNVQTVTYTYGMSSETTNLQLLTSAQRAAITFNYGYAYKDRLSCIRRNAEASCRVSNTYNTCPPDPAKPYGQTVQYNESVMSQQTAGGQSYSYSYAWLSCPRFDHQADYRPFQDQSTTVTDSNNAVTTVGTNQSGLPVQIVDALGRATTFGYALNNLWPNEAAVLSAKTDAEGRQEYWSVDDRGNVISYTRRAKPGSGLADLVSTASYPPSCATVITCNKPTSITDARGNVTDYSYDSTHGGVLTETAPPDAGGVRAVKRYAYAQRYAWLNNGAGGYVPASSPIWVKTEMRTCRTSATVGATCAAGAADEVVTTYEYGPDAGPNTLLVRGVAVTAGGVTARTCYTYDADGRKLSETSPLGMSGTCP